MENINEIDQKIIAINQEIITKCKSYGYEEVVNIIMEFGRALWSFTYGESNDNDQKYTNINGHFRIIDEKKLLKKLLDKKAETSEIAKIKDVFKIIVNKLCLKELWKYEEKTKFNTLLLDQVKLMRELIGIDGLRPDHELRYFIRRAIRQSYSSVLSSQIVHLFRLFAETINKIINTTNWSQSNKSIIYHEFKSYLETALKNDLQYKDNNPSIIDLFIECCRSIGYLQPGFKSGKVILETTFIDTEYLLSKLFGMPTGIEGFDDIFGDGLILAEEPALADPNQLPGRVILIKGRYGTGKTLLSLQLAVEIARKGGLAWVIPLEQSAEEILYALESMCDLSGEDIMVITTDTFSAVEVLQNRTDNRGALIILKTIKENYDLFLTDFVKNAELMIKYPLRLISVDPINSIGGQDSPKELRPQMIEKLGIIKDNHTNIILVAEESSNIKDELYFEENIADTVIKLSVDDQHYPTQRSIEITKSRLQREQSGKHPFTIKSGEGIKIFPSSIAVFTRIHSRRIRNPNSPVKFGLPSLDIILGSDGIYAGDVIVFQGESGSLRTQTGLLFLLGSDNIKDNNYPRFKYLSLLVAARDNETTIDQMRKQDFIRQHKSNPEKEFKVISLNRVDIVPGEIIQRIEQEIHDARPKGYQIDRVMLDSVAYWEMTCPFIAADKIFGDVLVDFMRRQGITSLFVCKKSLDKYSPVQQPIIGNADCIIDFERLKHHNIPRNIIQVQKTRNMKHQRGSFELILGTNGLEVKPFVLCKHEEIKAIPIRLFLHSETNKQQEYNNSLVKTVKAVLSSEVTIETQDRTSMRLLTFGPNLIVDELQIVQLDEFQIPTYRSGSWLSAPICKMVAAGKGEQILPLYEFATNQWNHNSFNDFRPPFREKICPKGINEFYAIPFYDNISLLAYRKDLLSENETKSWDTLANKCTEWEKSHSDPQMLFFDFPHTPVSIDNYNCLFFEILLSLTSFPEDGEQCPFRKWLNQPEAIEAAKLLRRLCRRSYLNSINKENKEMTALNVNNKAIVWRHWFSTFNQMASTISPEVLDQIKIVPLPGKDDKDVAIAGEWYLGISAYSTAPEVGLKIIELLTSEEAELERLNSGIGLPTHTRFYESANSDALVSPSFPMPKTDLMRLMNNAFRRSSFGCYSRVSTILAFHLKKCIEIPDNDEDSIYNKIQANFNSFNMQMDFLRSSHGCRYEAKI
jgi:KaiC/GvpD/RAD55 family RecA-like ATPase